ncbi:MAG: TraR/DksA C4-type zinc finger protein [Roseitalea porphyridii]
MEMPERARMKERLQAKLAELETLDASGAEIRRPVELDQQVQGRLSRMDAIQVQAMAEAGSRRRQAEQARIRAALARIAEGEYGYCVACGEPIAARRLENDPAVPNCVDCAA